MLGLLASLSLLAVSPAAPSVSVPGACALGPTGGDEAAMDLPELADLSAARCSAPPLVAGPPAGEEIFATPAVIDCRAPVVATLLQALVGECDGTARDASYRTSRDPDSERAPGSWRPAKRERSGKASLSSCAGVPTEGGDGTGGLSPIQPLALFAVPGIPEIEGTRFPQLATFSLTSRLPRPIERPPRT
jgi:hypothetical protein